MNHYKIVWTETHIVSNSGLIEAKNKTEARRKWFDYDFHSINDDVILLETKPKHLVEITLDDDKKDDESSNAFTEQKPKQKIALFVEEIEANK